MFFTFVGKFILAIIGIVLDLFGGDITIIEWIVEFMENHFWISSILIGGIWIIGGIVGMFDSTKDGNGKKDNAINDEKNVYVPFSYEKEIESYKRKNFSFVDAQGNIIKWGDSFIDTRGNWCKWGTGFYDYSDTYRKWGEDFVDASDSYVRWGETFIDASGSYVKL